MLLVELPLTIVLKFIKKNFDYVIDLQNSTRSSLYLLFVKLFTNSQSNGTSVFCTRRYKSENYKEHVITGLNKQINVKQKITSCLQDIFI